MRALRAIAWHTFRSAVRLRVLPVAGILLLLVVACLPLALRHDGTALGYAQITLSYTLALSTGLLAVLTLWLSCSTLARDLEEHRIEMIDVKPVPRWKIWAGTWLGIMGVNAVLLLPCGLSIYALLHFQSRSLAEDQRELLREQIFVARGSARPEVPDLEPYIEQQVAALTNQRPEALQMHQEMPRRVREMVGEQIRAPLETIPPGMGRTWRIPVASPGELAGKLLWLRVRFLSSSPYDTSTYVCHWRVGPPGTQRRDFSNTLAPGDPILFPLAPDLADGEGVLTVDFYNANASPLSFGLEDGIEVLYRKGGMLPNFLRGLVLIYLWLGLFAAMGLMASSLLSFPVAAFVTCGLALVGFSTGTLEQIVEQQGIVGVDQNTGKAGGTGFLNRLSVGAASGLLETIGLVRRFSPVAHLSEGRWIPWSWLLLSLLVNGALLGGACALIGMIILHRRELAAAKPF